MWKFGTKTWMEYKAGCLSDLLPETLKKGEKILSLERFFMQYWAVWEKETAEDCWSLRNHKECFPLQDEQHDAGLRRQLSQTGPVSSRRLWTGQLEYLRWSYFYTDNSTSCTEWNKKREHLKNPIKIEEIQEKNVLTEIEPLQLAF